MGVCSFTRRQNGLYVCDVLPEPHSTAMINTVAENELNFTTKEVMRARDLQRKVRSPTDSTFSSFSVTVFIIAVEWASGNTSQTYSPFCRRVNEQTPISNRWMNSSSCWSYIISWLRLHNIMQLLLDDDKPCTFPIKILSIRLYLRVLSIARMFFLLILLKHTTSTVLMQRNSKKVQLTGKQHLFLKVCRHLLHLWQRVFYCTHTTPWKHN